MTNTDTGRVDTAPSTTRRAWAVVWLPGLAVAAGAAVATAHGLFEVAVAARVPAGIAWIYPLITDGLALVAYTATSRLTCSAARYAWTVVIISAGLSGLAQASYLASDAATDGAALTVSAGLRFGVGAWPAVAAAVVAHLLYLLAVDGTDHPRHGVGGVPSDRPVPVSHVVPPSCRTTAPAPGTGAIGHPVPPALDGPVIQPDVAAVSRDQPTAATPEPDGSGAPARDHAREIAERHRARNGALPTVRELQDLAAVSRGTAARALTQLRDRTEQPENALHLVTDDTSTRTQP